MVRVSHAICYTRLATLQIPFVTQWRWKNDAGPALLTSSAFVFTYFCVIIVNLWGPVPMGIVWATSERTWPARHPGVLADVSCILTIFTHIREDMACQTPRNPRWCELHSYHTVYTHIREDLACQTPRNPHRCELYSYHIYPDICTRMLQCAATRVCGTILTTTSAATGAFRARRPAPASARGT